MQDHFRPKPLKDDNNHIDESKNNGYIHYKKNTEENSLAPQYSSSNIFNYSNIYDHFK